MLLRREAATAAPATDRVLQIGEGRFLRGFVDWLLQRAREEGRFDGAVVLTPARATGAAKIAALGAQDSLFTVWTRGLADGHAVDMTEVISIIGRLVDPFADWQAFLACAEVPTIDIVVSNTTELGIVYTPCPFPAEAAPVTYPARLTAYLARRFAHFMGAPEAGMVVLPCELIEENGRVLREIVIRHAEDWHLGPTFAAWLLEHNAFCNTLVDRIVPGFPRDGVEEAWARLGYEDSQLVVAEPFHLWAIEAEEWAWRRLPFAGTSLNVRHTDDLAPYRVQKLRVLNGTHTFMAAPGLAMGCATVREALEHSTLGPLIRSVLDEVIIPYSELDAETMRAYAATVLERFANPFIAHRLLDITLNSVSKWRIRLLPVIERYHAAHGSVPDAIAQSLAATLFLYREDSAWPVSDDPAVLAAMRRHWQEGADSADAVARILGDTALWRSDLTGLTGLVEQVANSMILLQAGTINLTN